MNDMVTSVEETQSGYSIVVNDTIAFTLSKSTYAVCPLHRNQPLDWEQYKLRLIAEQYPEALNQAVALLAIRARSEQEVRMRLERKSYLSDVIELTLYRLRKEGFLNDESFAHDWAQSRMRKQIGRSRILMELRQKGIDESIALKALDQLDDEDRDNQTMRLAAKVLRRYSQLEPKEALRKATASMLRRGFSYGEASRCLQAVMETIDQA